jgi:hypothetical protein
MGDARSAGGGTGATCWAPAALQELHNIHACVSQDLVNEPETELPLVAKTALLVKRLVQDEGVYLDTQDA